MFSEVQWQMNLQRPHCLNKVVVRVDIQRAAITVRQIRARDLPCKKLEAAQADIQRVATIAWPTQTQELRCLSLEAVRAVTRLAALTA